jgi:hypothetical protein
MMKTLLASASLSLVFLLMPSGAFGPVTTFGTAGLSPAHAIDIGVEVGGDDDDDGPTIGIGVGGGDEDDDDGDSAGGDDDDDDGPKAISCQRGKRVVEDAGFRRVRTRDCTGKTYRYFGRKKSNEYEITVSRFGRILSVRAR